MAFIISVLLLALFTGNVAIGAVGNGPVLGSVSEMLVLLAASIAFVVGILQREAAAKAAKKTNQ